MRLTKTLSRRIARLKRRYHHPLIHRVHRECRLSRKTLFYMKEYGPRSHIVGTIVRESLFVLVLAAVLSSVGGIGLRSVKGELIHVLPLLILLPALNDMIGDFGTVISAKFTTMLYLGKAGERWWRSKDVRNLVKMLFAVALISSVYIGLLAYALAMLRGFPFSGAIMAKVLLVAIASTMILTGIIFAVALFGGAEVCRKNEDPNNYLIPLTTAVADLGSMLLFAAMVGLIF